jgi:autophagy-related protein 18
MRLEKYTFCFRIKKSLKVLLASEDGFLYIYNLDVSEGGDCQLIRQFR